VTVAELEARRDDTDRLRGLAERNRREP
jgi:hypothetical protein